MESLKLYKIEKKKYSKIQLALVFLIITSLSILIEAIQIYKSGDILNETIIWNLIFDSVTFIKLILNSVLMAAIVSYSIQIENQNNMWKILQSSGRRLSKIYSVKYFYIMSRYFIFLSLEFSALIIFARIMGVKSEISLFLVGKYFIGIFTISLFIAMIHYFISIKWSNQLISMSISLMGTLVGVITVFISKTLMKILPYSWYAFLTTIDYEKNGDKFIRHIRDFEKFPIIASIVAAIVLFQIIKKIKVGE